MNRRIATGVAASAFVGAAWWASTGLSPNAPLKTPATRESDFCGTNYYSCGQPDERPLTCWVERSSQIAGGYEAICGTQDQRDSSPVAPNIACDAFETTITICVDGRTGKVVATIP